MNDNKEPIEVNTAMSVVLQVDYNNKKWDNLTNPTNPTNPTHE